MAKVTNQLTFDLKTNNTYCNSPGIWKIYGRNNSANSSQLINPITGPITNSLNILAPNKKNWEIFIAMVYDCRCMNSSISNKVFTDDQAPSYLEPDILSVNLGRSKVIMRSQYSRETDLMGYLLIKVNPINRVKELIGEKIVLFYSYASLTFNGKSNPHIFAIAGFDNCPNGVRLSNLQSPILFSIKPLLDYTCTKKIRFNSATYVGYAADAYDGYILDKKNTPLSFYRISQDCTSQEFKILYLNIEFIILIRASKSISTLVSTSNKLELRLSDFYRGSIPPNEHHVSLENELNINFECSIVPGRDGLLQYGDQNLSSWRYAFAISRETITTNLTHHLSNISLKTTNLSLIRYNSCKKIIDMNYITSNINLTNQNPRITWNEQRSWKVQSFNIDYIIQKKSDAVSHIIGHTQSSFYNLPGFGLSNVRIKAEIISAIKNGLNWSQSKKILRNLVFDSSENKTNLIPELLIQTDIIYYLAYQTKRVKLVYQQ